MSIIVASSFSSSWASSSAVFLGSSAACCFHEALETLCIIYSTCNCIMLARSVKPELAPMEPCL